MTGDTMISRRDRRVGLVYDERFLDHDPGDYRILYREPFPFEEPVPHMSNPLVVKRTKRLLDLLGYSAAMQAIDARIASDEELLGYHTPEYIARVAEVSHTGGDTGAGAPIAAGGDEIARLSAGAVIAATDAVMRGDVHHAYALTRPPGHHAMADKGMGFCVYANVAVAARHAQRVHGITRIAILDWDVHHGNGTQDAFYDDPDVLFISIHQEDLFPVGWGKLEDIGEGAGTGSTVNIPLPSGSGNRAYMAVMEQIVLPIIRQFGPELILVSAGQDASVQDPLGRMSLTTSAYRSMTSMMREIAGEVCGGRLVIAQEGGYSDWYAPYCSAAIAEGLMDGLNGVQPVGEPYGPRAESMPASRKISGDAQAAIDAALDALADRWNLRAMAER
jgi:acetoin utilization deacetylase AcuC-like enzyme